MRISVIGGGPAGLYFAVLARKAWPHGQVTVHERGGAQGGAGFGLVFSDASLAALQVQDSESHAAILKALVRWDGVEIRFKGEVRRIGGTGLCGCSRQALIGVLQDRARALGVVLTFGDEVGEALRFAGADLVVAADGAGSRVRSALVGSFGTSIDVRPNRYAWMGSARPLGAFTFDVRETEHGTFVAHAYPYADGRSAWVIETDARTCARAGLEAMDEAQSARFAEAVFEEALAGCRLVADAAPWRRFAVVRNGRWSKDNLVLLGDARATAHFSIGSGTRLAMEDAAALVGALQAEGAVPAALARFERGRRPEVETLQRRADGSMAWFERMDRFGALEPAQFAQELMTRARQEQDFLRVPKS